MNTLCGSSLFFIDCFKNCCNTPSSNSSPTDQLHHQQTATSSKVVPVSTTSNPNSYFEKQIEKVLSWMSLIGFPKEEIEHIRHIVVS